MPFADKDDYIDRPFDIVRVNQFIAKNVMTPDGVKTIPSWRLTCKVADTGEVAVFAVGQNDQRNEMMDALQWAIRNGERPRAMWSKREITSKAVGITEMYELVDA